MELLVDSCLSCGGFCCRGITLNPGRDDIPSYFKKVTGLDVLSHNPFMPLHELIMISSTRIVFYQCNKLNFRTGLCTCYEDRAEMCKTYPSPFDHDLLNFIFVVPWCAYRAKQLILKNEEYQIATLQQCMMFYSEITEDNWVSATVLDTCFRYSRYFSFRDEFSEMVIDQANDYFIQEVLNTYRAHFVYNFKQMTINMSTARNAFHQAAMLCYKFGISPEMFWNIARLYGEFSPKVYNKLPFPTYIMGKDFQRFLKERILKMESKGG